MTNFSWLHLTDLHQGMHEQPWLWPGVREIFFDDLQKLHDRCGPWDLVLFTGDLTQCGATEEFQKVDEILEQLWTYLKKLGSSPKLLAVPGNHDLLRPDADEPVVILLQEWQSRSKIGDRIRKIFWENRIPQYHQLIKKVFENYTNWWGNQPFRADDIQNGFLPGDFSVTVEKDGAKLGVVGLNTSFLQLTDDNYYGKLALHAKQFHEVCNGDGPVWAKQHHACVLLTHHPPIWLDKEAKSYLDAEITDHERFAVHLCGHMHETALREIREGKSNVRRIWQGCSLCGLEYFDSGYQNKRLHGYTAGKIELGRTGELRFWPREARLQGSERNIVPDFSIAINQDHYISSEHIRLLQPYILRNSHVVRNQSLS